MHSGQFDKFWDCLKLNFNLLSPHFLCWISGVVPFNAWLISTWEENECCYELRRCTKWQLRPFWVKIVAILSVAQLVTTVIFFLAWDKSHVKWDNSRNSTQKIRTYILNQNQFEISSNKMINLRFQRYKSV